MIICLLTENQKNAKIQDMSVTRGNTGLRPHLERVGWEILGGDGGQGPDPKRKEIRDGGRV